MLQDALFAPSSDWTLPDLNRLPDWSLAKRIGLDTETSDPQLKKLGPGVRRDGYMAGISFCAEDDRPYYLPFAHLGGGNLPRGRVLEYMRDQAAKFNGIIVGANLQYDLDYLAEQGVVFRRAEFRDVQVAAPLINELHMSYSLQKIAERAGMEGKDEVLLRRAAADFGVDPKKEMWKLHSKYVGPYAEEDASLPLRLLRKLEREIDAQDLWQIYKLECDVLPVLVKMRRRGVRIDLDALERVERWSLAQEAQALGEVKRLTGCRVEVGDVWKPEPMAEPLRQIGVVLTKTSNGKPSITKELLEGLEHPVGNLLLQARKVNKLRTTFAASVRRYMTNGRLHCTFNQLRRNKEDGDDAGARYGRLSSCDPNIQQQPARDEFAKMWRSIYVPEPGEIWCAADYSQQEPRWVTHFAEQVKVNGHHLRGAREAAERYRNDPKTDNHQMMTQLIHGEGIVRDDAYKQHRTACKQIYLGLIYGMGGVKLARKLGLPTEWIETRSGRQIEVAGREAQAIFDKFDNRAPFLRQMAELCEKTARKRGYLTTIYGRRCRFPEHPSGNGYDWCHKGLNRIIQGSSGDQTKKAMVDADRNGLRLLIQVHDEIGMSVPDEATANGLADIMMNTIPANVPFHVDVELGSSWGGSM